MKLMFASQKKSLKIGNHYMVYYKEGKPKALLSKMIPTDFCPM